MTCCIDRREMRAACKDLARDARALPANQARRRSITSLERAIRRLRDRVAELELVAERIESNRGALNDLVILLAFDEDASACRNVEDIAEALVHLELALQPRLRLGASRRGSRGARR